MTTSKTFRIRGSASAAKLERVKTVDGVVITGSHRLVPGSARDRAWKEHEVASDEVVRVELENGFVLWSRADDLLRERGKKTVSRDGSEAFEIDTRPPTRAGERGWLGLGVKVLEFFGIDLKKQAAGLLGRKLEERQLRPYAPGLHRCTLADDFALAPVADNERIAAAQGKPLLVFIHGTASSCRSSFGKLWDTDSQAGKSSRQTLKDAYGERVFAFEHRSLSESPIANALALAKRLPENAEVHLVTHSRGGLVGELMCLGQRERTTDPLKPELLKTLFAADRTIAEQLGLDPLDEKARKERDNAYEADRKNLADLIAVLDEKKLKASRFVRVACPARGTTLASGRLDRWLSVVDFLVGKATGEGLFADGLDFLLAVVKERTDPRTLPGLEAMMPGSALTRLLQHPDLSVTSDLSVISGDIEGDSLWSQIKLFATDWFYGADHDLVVNTGSMYGGIRRPEKGARFLRDQGPQVNHFNYFINDKSVRWLLAGLTRGDGADAGFQPMVAAKQEEPKWREAVRRSRSRSGAQPLAVVLPGTMGSVLQANGEEIWLNYWRLLRGGLKRLSMGQPDIVPTGLLDDFYGPMLEYLARSHRVEIFAYDWRQSVRDAATRLADQLEALLPDAERNGQPVHLVAHSMGGLVVRAMIGDARKGATVWRRIQALQNSRFMMLGTPNNGSYETVRWLTGSSPTELKLSLLDITQGTDEIIDIVRQFPGLLELLPFGADDADFSEPSRWKSLKDELNAGWGTAEEAVLRKARDTWALLRKSPPDSSRMVYVAGCHSATVCRYEVALQGDSLPAGRKRLDFFATRQGDGTVTWKSGALPDVKTWYVEDTEHDKLCAQKRAFPAYLDLLMTGKTTRLPDTPPAASRAAAGEPDPFPMPVVPFTDAMPDERSARALSFGPGRPVAEDEAAVVPVVKVSIRHGDLAYARHPVLVGHYMGDTIVSAEKQLDDRLDGALTRRLQLDLYPGRLDTHALFFSEKPTQKPAGAVVVGLGQVGELSPGLLERGVRAALLDLALQVGQRADQRSGSANEPRSVSLSCLLVGTGAGGMPVRDSIEAILRAAVGANTKLVDAELDHRVLVDEIEFLEIFEDVAINAAEALELALTDGELAQSVVWEKRVIEEGEGRRRRVRFEEPPAWWHRLEVIEETSRGVLRFIASTDRARAEETLATGQLQLADAFIREASKSASANTEVAKTLFEMILPNRLKELAPRQVDVVVLVDPVSARYPWELLEDRWSQNGRPPAVAAGLVRQLKTPQFRLHPAHAVDAKAFVVGNPDLSGWPLFADLPGARREATEVANLLEEAGFQVLDCIDQKSDDILAGLHEDAWRILHLAGHGEHEFQLQPEKETQAVPCGACGQVAPRPISTLSGMVIGRNAFLTPGDVEQMRWVPELVFINCCHLGKTQSRGTGEYNLLAANLAIQFVNMGVKAVVAGGWAVDDAAASAFATSFYTHMLAGEPFGESVRAAREEIWAQYPGTNTWGAYQCYGDPAYRLRGDGSAGKHGTPRPYHTPSELVADLNNHTEKIKMEFHDRGESEEELARWRAGISDHLVRIPNEKLRDEWLARADVAAAVGFAWGETRAYGEAVHWLEKSMKAEKGECSLRAVEQWANFEVRLAGEKWQKIQESGAEKEVAELRATLIERIRTAIAELDRICRLAATAERLKLLGSACKRLAWLQTDKERRLEALVDMANYYWKAYERQDKTEPYPFTNWAVAKLLAVQFDARLSGDWTNTMSNDVSRLLDAAQARNETDPTFWNGVAAGDCELVRLLDASRRKAKNGRPSAERIVELYRAAARRGASPRQFASVCEHLDFVIALSSAVPKPERSLLEALNSIRAAL
jgi:pimeloyl-ACP methyl ester carboxylesterase